MYISLTLSPFGDGFDKDLFLLCCQIDCQAKPGRWITGLAERLQQGFVPVWCFNEDLRLISVVGCSFYLPDLSLTFSLFNGEVAVEYKVLTIEPGG